MIPARVYLWMAGFAGPEDGRTPVNPDHAKCCFRLPGRNGRFRSGLLDSPIRGPPLKQRSETLSERALGLAGPRRTLACKLRNDVSIDFDERYQ